MTAAEQEVNDAMHEGVNILNGVMPVKIEKNDDNRAVAMIVADCTFDEKIYLCQLRVPNEELRQIS